MTDLNNDRYLKAFLPQPVDRTPVWMMRQAGRYLPEYQAIRKSRSLEEMFRTPELIFEITKQPLDILGVDAAILFADILNQPYTLELHSANDIHIILPNDTILVLKDSFFKSRNDDEIYSHNNLPTDLINQSYNSKTYSFHENTELFL